MLTIRTLMLSYAYGREMSNDYDRTTWIINFEKHNAIFKTFVIRLKGNLEKEQGQQSCNITSYAFLGQCCMVASQRTAHHKKNFFSICK